MITPLTVDFRQKTAAYGRIPTNFFRRDRGASEQEILTGRLVDRSIRPLFPANYNYEIQVTCNILSIDEKGDPEVLAINAASAALAHSSLPWNGPVGAVRVCCIDNEIVINPPRSVVRESPFNILLVGFNSSVVMLDLSANGVRETVLFPAIKSGIAECDLVASKILSAAKISGRPKQGMPDPVNADKTEVDECVKVLCEFKIKNIFKKFYHDKMSRDYELKETLKWAVSVLIKENSSFEEHSITESFYKAAKKTYRTLIMEEEMRYGTFCIVITVTKAVTYFIFPSLSVGVMAVD